MQTLGVVPRLFPEIEAVRKTPTILWREPRIKLGPMRCVCDGAPDRRVVVAVTRVTRMPLPQAAAFLGHSADWPPDGTLAGMPEHYPDIRWPDEVDAIGYLAPAEAA